MRFLMGKEEFLLKLFRLTTKFKLYLHSGIEIIYEGFWLGIMDNSNLAKTTQMHYSSAQIYQNDKHNLSGFLDWEKKVMDSYFKDCKNVLVGAAGGGREIIALSNCGIKVDAFECNPRLIDECRLLLDKVGIKARVVLAAPDNVPEEFGVYDGLIVGWGGYMHIIGSDTRTRFLKQCWEHIKPGGPILASFFIIHENSLQDDCVIRMAKLIRALRMSKEALESGDSLNHAGFCHKFSEEEIQNEFEKAGFDLKYYSEDSYPHAVGIALKEEVLDGIKK
jgi:2-polyprenyl-3-methyl-5-hydroxy-6-metoxy-1,4-benzoquinol methylase